MQLPKRQNKGFKKVQRDIWDGLHYPAEVVLNELLKDEWNCIQDEIIPMQRNENENIMARLAHFVIAPDTRLLLETIYAGDGASGE